jgi:ATP-dependent Clp protease ATP-binding subunit ClpC
MYERFTDRARKVMQLANQEAQRFNHQYIGTEHILLGLAEEGSGVAANVLKNLDIGLRKIRLEIEKIIQAGPRDDSSWGGKLPQTPRAKKVIEYSIEEARNLDHKYVGTEHLLLGLLREREGVAAQVLMNLGAKLADVRAEVLNLLGHNLPSEGGAGGERTAGKGKSKMPTLDSLCRDVSELARQGKLGPVIGRATEIERVIQVLACRDKSPIVLLSDSRFLRTYVIDGLARMLDDGRYQDVFQGMRVLAVKGASVLGGAALAQGGEKVLQSIRREARGGRALLFVNDFHLLFRTDSADAVWEAFLLQVRLDGIAWIGATSETLYRRYVEPYGESLGGFHEVRIAVASVPESVEILRGLREHYEEYHRVEIRDEALAAAVELSDRHLPGRCLPDKAIDVIDRAGALIRLRTAARPPDLKECDARIEQFDQEKEAAIAEGDFEKAARLRDQADKVKREKERKEREWREKQKDKVGVVDEETVRRVVAEVAGDPPRS